MRVARTTHQAHWVGFTTNRERHFPIAQVAALAIIAAVILERLTH